MDAYVFLVGESVCKSWWFNQRIMLFLYSWIFPIFAILKWLFIATLNSTPKVELQIFTTILALLNYLNNLWNKDWTLPRFELGTAKANSCKAFTCMNGMQACHQGCSAWSTNRIDIIIAKNNSSVCKCINVRGRNLIGPVKPHVIPTLLSKKTRLFQETLNLEKVCCTKSRWTKRRPTCQLQSAKNLHFKMKS